MRKSRKVEEILRKEKLQRLIDEQKKDDVEPMDDTLYVLPYKDWMDRDGYIVKQF